MVVGLVRLGGYVDFRIESNKYDYYFIRELCMLGIKVKILTRPVKEIERQLSSTWFKNCELDYIDPDLSDVDVIISQEPQKTFTDMSGVHMKIPSQVYTLRILKEYKGPVIYLNHDEKKALPVMLEGHLNEDEMYYACNTFEYYNNKNYTIYCSQDVTLHKSFYSSSLLEKLYDFKEGFTSLAIHMLDDFSVVFPGFKKKLLDPLKITDATYNEEKFADFNSRLAFYHKHLSCTLDIRLFDIGKFIEVLCTNTVPFIPRRFESQFFKYFSDVDLIRYLVYDDEELDEKQEFLKKNFQYRQRLVNRTKQQLQEYLKTKNQVRGMLAYLVSLDKKLRLNGNKVVADLVNELYEKEKDSKLTFTRDVAKTKRDMLLEYYTNEIPHVDSIENVRFFGEAQISEELIRKKFGRN